MKQQKCFPFILRVLLFSTLVLSLGFSSCGKNNKECIIKVIDWPEKDNDNDDFAEKHPDALKAGSKEDMVKKVEKKMKEDKCKCIKKLVLLGHGEPGTISVGAGRETLECKEIDGHKEEWGEILKPLKGKFCKNSEIILFGCNVGEGESGAAKLLEIANFFNVKVKAPTKAVYASEDPDDESDQEATPYNKPAPKGEGLPGKKLKKKSKTSISLPNPEDVEAMAIYECDREFYVNPPDTIDYFIQDENTIGALLEGVNYETEYDGKGLKSKYDARVYILQTDQSSLFFHLLLDWKAIEIRDNEISSVFVLTPEASELYRSLAR